MRRTVSGRLLGEQAYETHFFYYAVHWGFPGRVSSGARQYCRGAVGSDIQEQVSTDIFRIQSGPDELHGLFSGEVKLDWTVVGAYTDPLATPTPQPPELPLPPI